MKRTLLCLSAALLLGAQTTDQGQAWLSGTNRVAVDANVNAATLQVSGGQNSTTATATNGILLYATPYGKGIEVLENSQGYFGIDGPCDHPIFKAGIAVGCR